MLINTLCTPALATNCLERCPDLLIILIHSFGKVSLSAGGRVESKSSIFRLCHPPAPMSPLCLRLCTIMSFIQNQVPCQLVTLHLSLVSWCPRGVGMEKQQSRAASFRAFRGQVSPRPGSNRHLLHHVFGDVHWLCSGTWRGRENTVIIKFYL